MSPFMPISNFAFKNPMQTPMSRNLEMYNWWNECIKKAKPIVNKINFLKLNIFIG